MKFEPIAYASHYGGRCRGCADENGVCPTSGLPCDPDERLKAAAHCLKAWQYGIEHGHIDNPFPPSPASGSGGWQPIGLADKSIATVQSFPDVSVTLRNSYPVWVRDEDGRVYEAVWTEGHANYWWDLEGESPVDPVEFMPHPLDPRFANEALDV